MKLHRMFRRTLSLIVTACAVGSSTYVAHGSPQLGSMLLHSTMNDAAAIHQPAVAAATLATVNLAVPGNAPVPGTGAPQQNVFFEPGIFGAAARMDGPGYVYDWPNDGLVRFHGDNFDFSDPERDGGRLDFWVKFNLDPHATSANTWLARSSWGERHINFEFSGSPADLMVDVYGEVDHNYRTNYEKFRALPRGWSEYENIQQGEWNLFTFLWRNNGGPHKAEIHLFINGTQEGCTTCSDYNGNLPGDGDVTDFFFSPPLVDDYILFSIDEVYSFDSWDVTGLSGNFADLQIPEGVTLKYPQDKDYPIYGNPVPERNVTFEFTVVNDASPSCECDIYVDGDMVGSTTAISGAHTEWFYPEALVAKIYTWQVKCDDDRLVSPLNDFEAQATVTATENESVGGLKGRYR